MIVRSLLAVGTCLVVAGCGPAPRPSTGSQGGSAASGAQPGTGCVDEAAARTIWTTVDQKLNAIALDPKHAGLVDVSTGSALTGLQDYIKTTLIDKNLTEREVDTLDSLKVVQAACNGGPLQVTVKTTVAKDDYLKPDGSVDHADPSVGTQLDLLETFVRAGGAWKESDIQDANGPSPSSGPIV